MADPLWNKLHSQWQSLVHGFGIAPEQARRWFDDLAAHYAEPGRVYHTLRHIDEVLTTITDLCEPERDQAALQLAAWFHDVIYDSRRKDNEERSAAHAERVLATLQVPEPVIQRVTNLILLTRNHRADPADRDSRIFVDADLAILGATPDRYAEYARAIRAEYAWVPEQQYRSGRKHILQGFLDRDRIYYTEAMAREREEPARENLRREIRSLSTGE